MNEQDLPYLMRGMQILSTQSSVLVSSSRYLNNPQMREWIATSFLRRSGKDVPTSADAYQLHRILREMYDLDRIEELFTQERRRWPDLDRWFSEGFTSTFTKDDLLACPTGSFGYIFGRYLADNGFEIDIVPRFEPKTQFDYFTLRAGQTHDLEHIATGGNFDIIGELVPQFARISNLPRFLDPELTEIVNAGLLLAGLRLLCRTGLHHQAAFPTALTALQAGIQVGQQSGPFFMARFEDVFHLQLAEAREVLGMRGTGEGNVDTAEASLEWDEYR